MVKNRDGKTKKKNKRKKNKREELRRKENKEEEIWKIIKKCCEIEELEKVENDEKILKNLGRKENGEKEIGENRKRRNNWGGG